MILLCGTRTPQITIDNYHLDFTILVIINYHINFTENLHV